MKKSIRHHEVVSQRTGKNTTEKSDFDLFIFLYFALLADSNENSKCSLSIIEAFGEMCSVKFIARYDLWQTIEM